MTPKSKIKDNIKNIHQEEKPQIFLWSRKPASLVQIGLTLSKYSTTSCN